MAFYSYSVRTDSERFVFLIDLLLIWQGAHLILNLRSRVLGESATPTWNDTLEFVHPGSQRTQTTDLQLEDHPA